LSDETQRELREVQEYFRLPGIGLVEKDLYRFSSPVQEHAPMAYQNAQRNHSR
jgi:hypothetical protein